MSANSGSISPVIYLLFIFPLQYFSLSLNMPYLASEDGSPSFFKQFVNRSTYLFTFPYPFPSKKSIGTDGKVKPIIIKPQDFNLL